MFNLIAASVNPITSPIIQAGAQQDLFQLTARIDRLINSMAMLAAVLGLIVAIAIAFFAIRQIFVDREASAYKRELRERRVELQKETELIKYKFSEMLKSVEKLAKDFVNQIKKHTPKTEAEIDKVREQLKELKEAITFGSGVVSGIGSTVIAGRYSSPIFAAQENKESWDSIRWVEEEVTCKKCSKSYKPLTSFQVSSEGLSTLSTSTCPSCGNVN